jgi:hypothetical protein
LDLFSATIPRNQVAIHDFKLVVKSARGDEESDVGWNAQGCRAQGAPAPSEAFSPNRNFSITGGVRSARALGKRAACLELRLCTSGPRGQSAGDGSVSSEERGSWILLVILGIGLAILIVLAKLSGLDQVSQALPHALLTDPRFVFALSSGAPMFLCIGALLGYLNVRAAKQRLFLLCFLPGYFLAAVGFVVATVFATAVLPLPAPKKLAVGLIAVAPAVLLSFVSAVFVLLVRAPRWVLFAVPALACVVCSPLAGYLALLFVCAFGGDCL